MWRRHFLKLALGGAGAALLMDGGGSLALADESLMNACFKPWNAKTPRVSWPAKKPPYKIALSNSYDGNVWRSEMLNIARIYVERPEVKRYVKEFRVSSSGNNVSAQISQLNQMVLAGMDAILVDAASPSGLDGTIDKAVKAGVVVVSFDNTVTTPKSVTVNENQYEIGRRWAGFLVKQLHGQGKVLMVRGVSGTFVDDQRTEGATDVFEQHSGIRTVQVFGNWSDDTARQVTANALAVNGSFDGVWCQGGDVGVVRAFDDAGLSIPPMAGEAENGFRKLAAQRRFPMLSIGQSPSLSAVAVATAIALLRGQKVPQDIGVPLPAVTTDELKAGVNYFPKLSDGVYTPINIKPCGLEFKVDDVVSASS